MLTILSFAFSNAFFKSFELSETEAFPLLLGVTFTDTTLLFTVTTDSGRGVDAGEGAGVGADEPVVPGVSWFCVGGSVIGAGESTKAP